jgi:hypothetical protein
MEVTRMMMVTIITDIIVSTNSGGVSGMWRADLLHTKPSFILLFTFIDEEREAWRNYQFPWVTKLVGRGYRVWAQVQGSKILNVRGPKILADNVLQKLKGWR